VKVLLVHPDDSPEQGPWCHRDWDQVIDLGKGGYDFYKRLACQFSCPVIPLDSLRTGLREFERVREVFESGNNRLSDGEGLDWWKLTAIFFHQQIELLGILRRFADKLGESNQVFVTRPSFYSDALRFRLGDRLRFFSARSSAKRSALRYFRVAAKFPVAQLAEIFWDKYDPCYSLRHRFTAKRKPSRNPVVLLPSAYVNVSRMATAYARTVPEMDFLLVATRRSGWLAEPSANVTVAKLASYASYDPATAHEYDDLIQQWRSLQADLESIPEIAMLGRLGLLDSFPKLLRQGLATRDAWRHVFETESVKAVLCADDSNPYTRIPVLLARNRSIPTLSCHHGALDGGHLFKQSHADIILAKGRMEEDYLVRVCGVPAAKVEIGAPGRSPWLNAHRNRDEAPFITFFSEPYEVSSARGNEFYRDLLPRLADLALKTGHKLVVKLHPFESRRERQKLIKRILSREQQRVTTLVSGALSEDLLQKTWAGITVLSTAATECVARGIPCFLCGWLEYSHCAYIDQFEKFGVGQVLRTPEEIAKIPQLIKHYRQPEVPGNLWQPITSARLLELFSGAGKYDQAFAS
jgi:hypothetical protein